MKIPKTAQEMAKADYSLWHVKQVFPDIKPNTLQVQIKNGAIKPIVTSTGQGFPARFNYYDLISIGIMCRLSKIGFNRRDRLKSIIAYFSMLFKLNNAIGYDDLFDWFLIIPENAIDPPCFLHPKEFMGIYFNDTDSNYCAWIMISLRNIKNIIDAGLVNAN